MTVRRGGVQPKPQFAVSYLNPKVQAPGTQGVVMPEQGALAAAFASPNYLVLPMLHQPTASWVVASAN